MRGEQYHHNNPSELCENLYLCAARAISSKVMLELGITCVINATLELPTFAYQKQECMQIAVEDKVGSKLHVYFDMVADKIHSVLAKKGVVMIYCRAGMSRSATLCIAYFMRHHNMSMEEAFQYVKERRPIIHPNVGFVSQLRKYEDKLKFRRSGIKRKFEQDDFSYGSIQEIVAFEVVNFEDLTVIKPRPKPRIMKPKLVTPDQECMPLSIAQSYSITEVSFCLMEQAAQDIVEAAAIEKPKSKMPKGMTGKVNYSNLRRTGTRPKRPMSTPLRPRTPIMPMASTGSQDSKDDGQIISNWGYHDPMSVAESIEPLPMESTQPQASSISIQAQKKRPFSKISEPARVAVSFQSFPWALCAPFSHKASFHAEVPFYTVFADLHLPLATKSEEVTLECPQKVLVTKQQQHHSLPPIHQSKEERLMGRARCLVSSLRCSPATIHSPVILDCPGIFQAQKVDANFTLSSAVVLPNQNQHVPSRFAANKTPGAGLSRTSTTRASIKLSSGIKFSPVPVGHKKRPVPNLDLDGVRQVSCNYIPPLILEKLQTNIKTFKPPSVTAKSKVYCPELGVASKFSSTVFDKAIKDTSLSFKLPWLLTVPKRSVLLATHALTSSQEFLYNQAQALETVMPHKEYPYYYPVRRQGSAFLDRAVSAPKVEVSWLSNAKGKDSQLVVKVKEISPQDQAKKRVFEPQINWAATRCEFDPCTVGMVTRSIEDLPPACKAKASYQKSIKDSKYRSSACQIFDCTSTPLQDVVPLPKAKSPEKYNTLMISRFVHWPLYQVLSLSLQESCQMLNFYCEPTPFKAWAKVTSHTATNEEKCHQQPAALVGLQVASCQIATYNDNLTELVDIPDVVGDVSQIQPLIAQQKDPAKMLIWMEVFKRSIIKARPLKPFVKLGEMLPVADSVTTQVFNDCTTFHKIPPTIPTARALVTTVSSLPSAKFARKRKDDICYPIEVVECFRAGMLHAFNPHLMKIIAISQREKAIETTEYIRNYTRSYWTCAMEENEVVSWMKAPEITYNLVRATGIIYMPLKTAHENKNDIFGCVEEHSELEGPSVVDWLKRQPFRFIISMLL